MVKYIGSKRLLAPGIGRAASVLPITTACDVFAGTTRVGQALRCAGVTVHSNDTASYSEVLGQAYIAATRADHRRIGDLLRHLAAMRPYHGYFTETFCVRSRFFQPHNGMRVDAIRDEIERMHLTPLERGLALTSLLEAADRVDSTCGVQMAYVKAWAPRSFADLELRVPACVAGPPGTVTRVDAAELAPRLVGVDCAYLDPPYNQHSYYSNYHIWETLIRWDRPDTYGVACKRIDCKVTKSPFNSKRQAWEQFSVLIEALPTPWVIVSFSDEGFHDLDAVASLLAEKGYLRAVAVDFKRYVGAQIGIHDPAGRRVGRVSHLRNTEVTFIVGPDRALVERAGDAMASAESSGARGGAPDVVSTPTRRAGARGAR